MQKTDLWVDNRAHLLHLGDQTFSCDRDVEAVLPWHDQALLLSSDTDCLSLWDADGLLRLTRVGVYPQDAAHDGDAVYVCGGADSRLHILSLPGLHELNWVLLPGMTERIALHSGVAYVLTLLTEPTVETALLRVDPASGCWQEIGRYAGLPGALHADDAGLWVAVSGQLQRLSWPSLQPEHVIDGFGLIRWLISQPPGLIAVDPLEERATFISDGFVPFPAPYAAYRLDPLTR